MSARSFMALAAVVVAGGFGCGDAENASASEAQLAQCPAPAAPKALDPAPVSLENDVFPIVKRACSFAACHGGRMQAPTLASAAAMRDALVGKPSTQLPAMPYVTAGDPENSYLLHKLDGDQCALAERCVGGSCKETMPKGGALLPESERDTIRRWIAQGAK